MSFRKCEYCNGGDRDYRSRVLVSRTVRAYSNTSSRDLVLIFSGGGAYQVPEIIIHYVADHGWRPPEKFIADVMQRQILPPSTAPQQPFSTLITLQNVGYLRGDDLSKSRGPVPEGFVGALAQILKKARESPSLRISDITSAAQS